MLNRLEIFFLRFRRRLSRADWAARLLGLKREPVQDTPGLLMIQIDGLGFQQFQRALKEGKLPFLNRLIQEQGYTVHSFYSGLPSATPGVQGELFYGVKSCVPSFSFMDRKDGRIRKMFDLRSVQEVEEQLAGAGKPLLEGGSAYCDIFTGGARECHFSGAKRGWDGILWASNPMVFPFLLLLYADVTLLLPLLLGWELVISFLGALLGMIRGFVLKQELEFISIRLSVCIFLRELIVAGAELDLARGLPVIHMNFFGYDEHSHRRGPGSRFASWVLPGIDGAVARIWRASQRSTRAYDVWIYSDHGQEKTVPYALKHSRSLQKTVEETAQRELSGREQTVVIAGMGPIAQIYFSQPVNDQELERIACSLAESGGVPTLLAPAGDGKATAWTETGTFSLPEDAAHVLGARHPFLEEAAADLVRLSHHPNAGTLLALGWHRGEDATLTFPMENGSHAGPGYQETHAFALLPPDAPVDPERPYIRPIELRKAALRFMGRAEAGPSRPARPAPALSPRLRIMTYNVHNCLGLDGKLSPERIARVISRHQPDAVALQELDVNRLRTGRVDQAHLIAKKLQMTFHFHTSFRLADEQYGNAILSRFPMRLVKAGGLPRLAGAPGGEPRGALWVELDVHGAGVHLINTHLSLWPAERLLQAEALLGPDWVGSPEALGPFILCGDFNSLPGSAVYRRLSQQFRDSQLALKQHLPKGTWFGRHPFNRIDHVFLGPGVEVLDLVIPDTELDRMASDHLPLMAELRLLVMRPPVPGLPKEWREAGPQNHENNVI